MRALLYLSAELLESLRVRTELNFRNEVFDISRSRKLGAPKIGYRLGLSMR